MRLNELSHRSNLVGGGVVIAEEVRTTQGFGAAFYQCLEPVRSTLCNLNT